MALNPAPDRLPCGRDPLTVADHARAGHLDAHAGSCPYCAAVIADDAVLRRAGRALAAQPIQPPDSLLPALMRRVRAELRPSRQLAMPSPAGPAAVTEHAVGNALRFTLDNLPGVRVRTSRVEDATPAPAGRKRSAQPDLSVHLSLSLAYNSDIISTTDQLRRRVIDACGELFGLQIRRVNLAVVDVHLPGGDGR